MKGTPGVFAWSLNTPPPGVDGVTVELVSLSIKVEIATATVCKVSEAVTVLE